MEFLTWLLLDIVHFFFHYIMKKLKEILHCTKEHLSLLKYLKMIVFLGTKCINLK